MKRPALFRVLLYAAFFASGAGSLIAEVTWNRMLIVVVGNSVAATALIVAVFMGGLGLGSAIGGRVFARTRSLLPYVVLEASVGAYVLLSPMLVTTLSEAFTALAPAVRQPALLTMVRLVVTASALLAPAIVMGATFPAIISAARGGTARAAYLYGFNTLGAAIGCFAGGYHLLLEFGVRATLFVAAACYALAVAAALCAYAVDAPDSTPAPSPGATPEAAGLPLARSRRRFLLWASGCIGFVALGYEVLLTRLGILYLGNIISVFPLVLTGFLLGSGISAIAGARLYGAFKRRGWPHREIGIAAILSAIALVAIPYLFLSDGFFRRMELSEFSRANPWPVVLLMVVPTFFMGSVLVLVIRMLGEDGPVAPSAATAYAVNTGGALLGAALLNHVLVPAIGTQAVLALLAAICVCVGGIDLFWPASAPRRLAGAAMAVVAAVGVMALPSVKSAYASKIALATRARSTAVHLVQEGRAATVTVLDQDDAERGAFRDMYLNGVEEASTRPWHTHLFKLLGTVPVFLHQSDGPKDVLVIAFGAGITAGSVLASDEVRSLDVVDLNPDVQGINDLFTGVNGDVFHQPRFHFHNDDGRNFLVTTPRTYDVISSDSTHPRAYDSWILYTEEFYRSVKARLKPGGVFAQWVPVEPTMQGALFRIHLNTFRKVFPNATFWYVAGSDQAFLVGTPEPLTIDAARLQAKLDRLPAWFRAREYWMDTAARVAGTLFLDAPAMARLIGDEQRVNRDDAHFFDKQSAVAMVPARERLPFFQADAAGVLVNASEAIRKSVREEQEQAHRLAMHFYFDNEDDLRQAYCAQPDNPDVRFYFARESDGVLPDAGPFCRAGEILTYRAVLAQHPGNADALNALADLLCEEGRLDEALTLSQQALRARPGSGMFLDTYGWILSKQNRLDESVAALQQAAALLPDHPIVSSHLAAVRVARANQVVSRK
jgi:spermidine synthase